jgi:hypothetical protein
MTQLRQKMEELQRRHCSDRSAKTYIRIVRDFAAYFHRPPAKFVRAVDGIRKCESPECTPGQCRRVERRKSALSSRHGARKVPGISRSPDCVARRGCSRGFRFHLPVAMASSEARSGPHLTPCCSGDDRVRDRALSKKWVARVAKPALGPYR